MREIKVKWFLFYFCVILKIWSNLNNIIQISLIWRGLSDYFICSRLLRWNVPQHTVRKLLSLPSETKKNRSGLWVALTHRVMAYSSRKRKSTNKTILHFSSNCNQPSGIWPTFQLKLTHSSFLKENNNFCKRQQFPNWGNFERRNIVFLNLTKIFLVKKIVKILHS